MTIQNAAGRSGNSARRRFFLLNGLCFLTIAFFLASPSSGQEPDAEPLPAGPKTHKTNPFLPAASFDSGWPFIRNSTFDGHSPEIHIADSWPDEGPPVLWTRELGQGYSAFVAKGERVFTQAQTLGGQVVLCLDADTGETIWSHRYDLPSAPLSLYPGPKATPTLDGEHVYFAAPDGLIGCLKQSDGDEVWWRNVVEDYDGEGIEFGYSCSPTVVDGLVILPVGGKGASLVALNAKTGKEAWRSGDDPASYTPAYPISIGGRKTIVGYLQNSLVLCELKTGKQLAWMSLSNGYDEHSAWPIYREPCLWISGPFRSGSELLEIAPTEDSDKSEFPFQFKKVWKNRNLSNDVTSSVLVDGHLYGFDIFDAQSKTQRPSRGKFRCVNFLTGETTWEIGTGRPRRLNSTRPADAEPEIGQSGIVVADGKLIILNELGELILARVNPKRYEELARTSVLGGELTWTPPILHRGRVYIRNHSRAVCVFVGEPERLKAQAPLLTVADVPQSEYTDWAATLLAIEPEYAFDIPSDVWLNRWLIAGLNILVIGSAVGMGLQWMFPRVNMHAACLIVAAILGALGTTLLSRATGEFYFTWQLVVFASFEPLGSTLRLRRPKPGERFVGATPPSKWNERLRWVLFLAVSAFFFWLCRRLSLVFEWAYLAGFVGAAPFCWLSARLTSRQGSLNEPARHLLRLIGFLAFSLVAAGVLATRYR